MKICIRNSSLVKQRIHFLVKTWSVEMDSRGTFEAQNLEHALLQSWKSPTWFLCNLNFRAIFFHLTHTEKKARNNYFPYSRLNSREQKNFSTLNFSFPVLKMAWFCPRDEGKRGLECRFHCEPKASIWNSHKRPLFPKSRGQNQSHFSTGKLNFREETFFCCQECSLLYGM